MSNVLVYSGSGEGIPLEPPESRALTGPLSHPLGRGRTADARAAWNSPNDDSVLGNPLYKVESETKSIAKYLNSRFLEPPVPETTVARPFD